MTTDATRVPGNSRARRRPNAIHAGRLTALGWPSCPIATAPHRLILLNSAGGEAWALTKGKRAVQDFEWSPDGRFIAFLAPEAKSDDDEKKEKDKDDARVVDKDDRPAHLWTVDVATSAVEGKRLIGAPWKFGELAWTPAGDRLIVVATDRPESDQLTERIFGVSIATPVMAELVAPVGPFSDIRVSPDGKSLA